MLEKFKMGPHYTGLYRQGVVNSGLNVLLMATLLVLNSNLIFLVFFNLVLSV